MTGIRTRMNFERANGWLRAGKAATALNAKIALHELNTISLEEKERADS